MSPNRVHNLNAKAPLAAIPGGRRRGFVGSCSKAICVVLLALLTVPSASGAAASVVLASDPNGINLTTVGSNYTATLGTMNALGVGSPATNVNVIQLSNGSLYYTYYDVSVSNLPGTHTAYLTAYAGPNFSNPSALSLQSCQYPSSCNASGNYSAMSTSSTMQTAIIAASPGVGNGTVKVGLAIMVPDNNGALAFAGTDSVTINFTAIDSANGKTIATFTLTLGPQTLQKAVQLTLSTHTGGLAVGSGSDYSMNFMNVNGLGIGTPASGLTTTSAANGIIYGTPYDLNPAYSDLPATTATITVCLPTSFTHSTILTPQDSATGAVGSYSAILACSSPTTISSTAADRSPITRYLGVFVSNQNGASAFTGSDTATLTYTMTVP